MIGAALSVRRSGLLMTGLGVAATAIALYLAAVKLSGGSPACGVLAGCDTVNSSEYAQVLGIPVALFGTAASLVTTVAAFAWWRRGWRPGLLAAYVIGLVALPILAYFTYLELFVIHAICIWCVAYAVAVVAGWLVAASAMTRRQAAEADD